MRRPDGRIHRFLDSDGAWASVQPEFEECDRTLQVHDAIVALADAMAYSNA